MRRVSIYNDRVLNQDSGLHLIHGINRPVVVGSRDSSIAEAVRSVRFPITLLGPAVLGGPQSAITHPPSGARVKPGVHREAQEKGHSIPILSAFISRQRRPSRRERADRGLQKQAMLPSHLSLVQGIGELEFLRHHHPKSIRLWKKPHSSSLALCTRTFRTLHTMSTRLFSGTPATWLHRFG